MKTYSGSSVAEEECIDGSVTQRPGSLNNEARTAIANYLSVHVGNEMTSGTAVVKRPLHPAIERASEIIDKYFTDIIVQDQDIFSDEAQQLKLVSMLKTKEGKNVIDANKYAFASNANRDRFCEKLLPYLRYFY